MLNPETILFAIRAGLQLYGAARKAYIDGTRGRPLVLPLPRAPGVTFTTAIAFFLGDGQDIAEANPRVAELIATDDLSDDEKAELVELMIALRPSEPPETETPGAVPGLIGSEEDLLALVTVRQWANGRYGPEPTALQQVAGTLVNLAVDYFTQTPGAVSESHPEGRALKAFLEALDDKDFATIEVTDIAPELMIAVVESVSAHPDLLAGGQKEQELVKHVTSSLASSAKTFLAEASSAERREASQWLQLVGRSLLETGAETVLANPQRFLGVGEGEAALISRVGTVVSDLVIGEDSLTFRPLLSADGLNKVTSAVLAAIADNPDLLKLEDAGVKSILLAVAADVAKLPNLLSKDVFPELVRLILEKSSANMDLIWGRRFRSPKRHLLVTASQALLKELSRKTTGATWAPALTGTQLLTTAEAVLDEVVDNPSWLVSRAGQSDSVLGEAIQAVMDTLRSVDGDRISADTGLAILRVALGAVGNHIGFLGELPATANGPARVAISAALDAVFATVFADGNEAEAQWTLARNSALTALVEVALDELADTAIGDAEIAVLRDVVSQTLASGTRFRVERFAEILRQRLEQAA